MHCLFQRALSLAEFRDHSSRRVKFTAKVKGELLCRILAECKKALRRENGERFGLKVTFAVLYARRDR